MHAGVLRGQGRARDVVDLAPVDRLVRGRGTSRGRGRVKGRGMARGRQGQG